VIRHFVETGWIYHGEVVIDKDPQAVACRTKKTSLMFVTKRRDATVLSPVFADYVCIFRKPGENAVPVQHAPHGEVTDEDWIRWARPIWYDIEETRVLNAALARDEEDERHVCPLSLDTIERCIKLWSNPGEIVLSPFAGIGSEVYQAIRFGRRGVGIELKESYFRRAVINCQEAERLTRTLTLFDEVSG
jgi:DNA methylase